MSKAIICDQCGSVLPVDHHGEAVNGEEAGWLVVDSSNTHADLCTRACAVEYIQSEQFVAAHEAQLQVISEIARAIAEGRDE